MHRENRLSGGVVDVEFFGSFLDGFVFIEDLGQESCSEGFCDLVVFTLGVRSLTENFQIDFSKDIFDDFHFCFVFLPRFHTLLELEITIKEGLRYLE